MRTQHSNLCAQLSSLKYLLPVFLLLIPYMTPLLFSQTSTSNLKGSIKSTFVDSQNQLWLIQYPGLTHFSPIGEIHFTQRDGLASDSVTSICEDNSGKIWIGTTNGISTYDGISFKTLSYKDGLINKRINHIYKAANGLIWVATDNGPHYFDDGRFFLFDALKNITVYEINENESEMIFVTEKGIQKTTKQDSISTSDLTTWLLVFLIVFILVFLLVFSIHKIRSNAALKVRYTLIEQQALLGQMNPHFIFNALNSIQKYILNNNTEPAHEYLSKFGNLMRAVLENSRRTLIPISEEIKTLDLYLQIESLRFENGFDYKINVTSDELLSYEIPTMMLQPFVENAIWHGLMNKQNHGNILISFNIIDDNYLECIIQDNGIGREQARLLSSPERNERKSRATEIVQQRIELINMNKKRKIELQINDLKENNTVSGTRVFLKIPRRFM